jgi:hypothetical protein
MTRFVKDKSGLLGLDPYGCGWIGDSQGPFILTLRQATRLLDKVGDQFGDPSQLIDQMELAGVVESLDSIIESVLQAPAAADDDMDGMSMHIEASGLGSQLPHGYLKGGNPALTKVAFWHLEMAIANLHQNTASKMFGLSFPQARRLINQLVRSGVPMDRADHVRRLEANQLALPVSDRSGS